MPHNELSKDKKPQDHPATALSPVKLAPMDAHYAGHPILVLRRMIFEDSLARYTKDKEDFDRLAKENHLRWSQQPKTQKAQQVTVIDSDWGDAVAAASQESGEIYTVLNMAHHMVPGGGVLNGMVAQEENMFRRAPGCYLDQTGHKTTSHGTERYTQEMSDLVDGKHGRVYLAQEARICIKGSELPGSKGTGYELLKEDELFQFFELRSAAVDLRIPGGFRTYTETDHKTMRQKIAAQLDTAIEVGKKHLILSAFGCGAFGCPADKVALLYREEIEKRAEHFEDIRFAIYTGSGVGPKDNLTHFKQVFAQPLLLGNAAKQTKIAPPEQIKTAHWKPNGKDKRGMTTLLGRQYLSEDGTLIPPEVRGAHLPAIKRVDKVEQSPEKLAKLLETTRLYTNLPTPFYEQLLTILSQEKESPFPTITQDKSPTVVECILRMSSQHQELLSLHHWKVLGWGSEELYQQWLNTPLLFAFAGSGHYCQTPRVFDLDPNHKGEEDQFLLVNETDTPKTTNIFSVAGFECRGIHDPKIIEEAIKSKQVQNYSALIMEQILNAATQTETTDIVFIPVGMGVFLRHKKEEMKAEMLSGWINALNAYQGPARILHCCLMPGQFEAIQKALLNDKITLVNHAGEDAYTVANTIQDELGRKSMLVNAGDHDWIVAFEEDKRPGQFSLGHTLFYSTSDEYFGLMTLFPAFSIANLRKCFTHLKQFIIGMPTPQVEQQKEKTVFDSKVSTHTIENKYAYKTFTPIHRRFHFFTVSSAQFKGLNPKYIKSTGDYLKTQILEDFKSQIEQTTSNEELNQLKIKLQQTPEFQVLKTGQGLFTRITGIKTSSVTAFEEMCQEQALYLEHFPHKPNNN